MHTKESNESQQSSILSHALNKSEQEIFKVCIIGNGNWASAISTLVGSNCMRLAFCQERVCMWVYEEEVELEYGEKKNLSEVINARHDNVKYLPGILLPENVVAVPDLAKACHAATLLIFVLPHQYLPNLLPVIRASVHPSCRGVSLIKGLGKLPLRPVHEISWIVYYSLNHFSTL